MNLKTIINELYYSAPSSWIKKIKILMRNKLSYLSVNNTHLAKILDSNYFRKRDPVIQKLIDRVCLGEELSSVLMGFNGKEYDERIVEYPYFVSWLLKQKKKIDILDIGCVLNNWLVSKTLQERCRRIWLCNPAIESKIFIKNPLYYHVAHLEKSFPCGTKFPLITCLSTIEHIGYDNSQYGGYKQGVYQIPRIEPLLNSLKKLAFLTLNGGNILISVPFGYREVLVHPVTHEISSQVFDYISLQKGMEALTEEGFMCELEVFSATESGWVSADPMTCTARYAYGCPAAGAVAFIQGKKIS